MTQKNRSPELRFLLVIGVDVSGAKSRLENKEEDNRQTGASGQGHQPGHKDSAHHAQVNSGNTACKADTQYRTDQSVSGGNG